MAPRGRVRGCRCPELVAIPVSAQITGTGTFDCTTPPDQRNPLPSIRGGANLYVCAHSAVTGKNHALWVPITIKQ
jgi:hypothetical protein